MNFEFRSCCIFLCFLFSALGACRSHAPAAGDSKNDRLAPGETEVIVFCSGPEYETTTDALRAHALGESMDMNIAKRKAMSNARLELASAIETTVKGVTESYVNSADVNSHEQLSERYESLNREVVNQQLRGMRVICERYTRTTEGTYKAYVAIELSATNLVDDYYKRIAVENQDVGYDDVKKTFLHQMQAASDTTALHK